MSGCAKARLSAAALTITLGASMAVAAVTIPSTDPNFGLSPYTWKVTGANADARIEATFPGAYLKTIVKGTTTVGLVIDGTANTGCPASSMPVIEYSLDNGPFMVRQLTEQGAVYTLPIGQSLDAATPHHLEVYFRAADLMQSRWTSSIDHLRIVGIAADDGASLLPVPKRAKFAIGFGDSITEGVGVDGSFTSWQILDPNNARGTWFPLVCSALDCEYGQFGSGGQGMVVTGLAVPPLPQAWDHYDATTPRLQNGKLLPEPDYVFCNMGTNDYVFFNWGKNDMSSMITAYVNWLTAVRAACPHTRIFCIVPISGWMRSQVQAAVTERRKKDKNVYLIDIPALNALTPNGGKPTQLAWDGTHPTLYGQSVYAANIVTEVQKILNKKK